MYTVRNAVQALVLVVTGAALTGCGGGGSHTPSTINVKATYGTWIEVREAKADPSNPRVRVSEPLTNDLRKLTIQEDGTYTMVLVTKSGNPIEGAVIKGKWTNDERMIEFSSDDNKFPSKLEALEPLNTSGVIDAPEGKRLVVEDLDSSLVRFKRVE